MVMQQKKEIYENKQSKQIKAPRELPYKHPWCTNPLFNFLYQLNCIVIPLKKILTGLFFDTELLSSKWDENIVQENMVQEANAAATVTFSEGQTPVKELLTKFLREEKEQSDMVDNV